MDSLDHRDRTPYRSREIDKYPPTALGPCRIEAAGLLSDICRTDRDEVLRVLCQEANAAISAAKYLFILR